MNMPTNGSEMRCPQSCNGAPHGFSNERRRLQILKIAEKQFVSTGLGTTTAASIAKAAGVAEETLYVHFGTKEKLFEEVVERNAQDRLAALRERFSSIPDVSPLECIESMAESTVLACVDDTGNASVMTWGLQEMPEFAADVYRAEIGASEALWYTEIATRLADSRLRTRVAVHLVPYAVHACMAFGLWLATLRHKPATAQAHAHQYADAVVQVARAVLSPRELLDAATTRLIGAECDFLGCSSTAK
jgi:AcrR family transcriptional regulator